MEKIYPSIAEGEDCRELFQEAYENRYTWDSDFKGYKGLCTLEDGNSTYKGSFNLSSEMKVNVEGIDNDEKNKLIASQLWEIAIHRVRREFNYVHGENTFTAGNQNEIGLEVIVGGKNSGDKYRIKDKVVTMVYRHIHGSLVNIFTNKVIDVGQGYLSANYTSQYLDPATNLPKTGISKFSDEFISLEGSQYWTLSKRTIERIKWKDAPSYRRTFAFSNLHENY